MKTYLFTVTLCCFSNFLLAQYSPNTTTINEISETLTDYIEGSTNGQPERLKTAFHPNLNLYYVKDETLEVWSGQDYIKATKEGQPTGELGKIIAIDFENNISVAKVQIANPNSESSYVDYFMLMKIDGHWTIIHKMFTKRVR